MADSWRFLSLALVVPACTTPPAGLNAGRCLEDTDCPGALVCVRAGAAGEEGACGCRGDEHCPAWTERDPANPVRGRAYAQTCDVVSNSCACSVEGLCPRLLTCSAEHRCVCRTDADCGRAGCSCSLGLCVTARGDDTVLCELAVEAQPARQTADAGSTTDAGPAADTGPAADSGTDVAPTAPGP